MKVICLKCKAKLSIPDTKAGDTQLKVKCPGCGLVFPLGKAPRADAKARKEPSPGPSQGQGLQATAGAPASAPQAPQPGPAPQASAQAAAASPSAQAHSELKPSPPPTGSIDWRLCANHPERRSERSCTECGRGWCGQCLKRVNNAYMCPSCELPCLRTSELETAAERELRRAKPLFDQVSTILRYPFTDTPAFVMLALFVGILSIFGLLGQILARGLLFGYSFRVVSRVSSGDLKFSTPEFRDVIDDIVSPLFLGLAAYIVSTAPLVYFLVAFGVSFMSAGLEGGSPGQVLVNLLLVGVGLLWALFYAPVALIVATFSNSVIETLKPWVGIGTIQRMGKVYWQAWAICVGLFVIQIALSFPFQLIPIFGRFASGVISTYAFIATGCALGIAVDKKSEELGLD